nr:MAG TPA: hypothetical protein [Caudoviricetes sp.]
MIKWNRTVSVYRPFTAQGAAVFRPAFVNFLIFCRVPCPCRSRGPGKRTSEPDPHRALLRWDTYIIFSKREYVNIEISKRETLCTCTNKNSLFVKYYRKKVLL